MIRICDDGVTQKIIIDGVLHYEGTTIPYGVLYDLLDKGLLIKGNVEVDIEKKDKAEDGETVS